MREATICQCGKPTGSTASLCKGCRKTLEIAIVNTAAYYADIDTLKTRQVRFGQGGRSNGMPMGMDARFAKLGGGSEVEYAAKNTVVAWVRIAAEYLSVEQGPTCGPFCLHVSCAMIRRTRLPVDDMTSMCAYLLRQADWFRVGPLGPEILDEMLDVEKRLRKLIDRPADRWYAGPCNAIVIGDDEDGVECGEPLYALTDFGEVECRKCEATYTVKERRDWLLAHADDESAPISVIARAITALSDDVRDNAKLAARMRQWAARNRIFPTRHEMIDGRLRPLFRVGEMRDLLAEDARLAQEKMLRKVRKLAG